MMQSFRSRVSDYLVPALPQNSLANGELGGEPLPQQSQFAVTVLLATPSDMRSCRSGQSRWTVLEHSSGSDRDKLGGGGGGGLRCDLQCFLDCFGFDTEHASGQPVRRNISADQLAILIHGLASGDRPKSCSGDGGTCASL